jgi:UPF0755 protein
VSDDLGLGLHHDEATGRGPAPHYRRRGIVLGAVLVVTVLLILAVVVVVARLAGDVFGSPADYSGPGSGSTVVQVHAGDSLSAIGQDLRSAGVVRSAAAFTAVASSDPRARSIGPGFYRLRLHMKASLALALLLDPRSLIESRVVVPEGLTQRDIFARIVSATGVSKADLQAAAADPVALGVPAWGSGHPLEGFLFPATYDFAPGTTARQALTAMVRRFNQAAATVDLVTAARRSGLTPYQVLVLASIVQREGRLTSDFPTIAEVFLNRLHRGIRLGSDATLYYVLPPGHGPLTASDLALDTPYNTRLHAGLPPTPINSAGQAAIEAVLHPSVGDYLYFVTIDKAGHAAFATTLDEFNRLVARSRANGVQ